MEELMGAIIDHQKAAASRKGSQSKAAGASAPDLAQARSTLKAAMHGTAPRQQKRHRSSPDAKGSCGRGKRGSGKRDEKGSGKRSGG
eukprot:2787535-Rhodomonas_salina.1